MEDIVEIVIRCFEGNGDLVEMYWRFFVELQSRYSGKHGGVTNFSAFAMAVPV